MVATDDCSVAAEDRDIPQACSSKNKHQISSNNSHNNSLNNSLNNSRNNSENQ